MLSLPPLTILEEFLLLALDDQAGDFWLMPRSIFDAATACAVIMDLMYQRRVDCDLQHLFVTSTEPTGDDILDPVLRALALEPVLQATRAIADELRFLSAEGEAFRERGLQRLIDRGILSRRDKKILWVFGTRRYPVIHDQEMREVKLRILHVILGDDIPETRDMMLVALANACGLFAHILSDHELAHAGPRIEHVARMDLLGRAVADVIADVEASIAMSVGLR